MVMAFETDQAVSVFFAALAFTGTFSGEECLVRDQRKNQREKVADKEHGGDGQGKILLGLRRPAARLPIGRQVKNRRNDQPDGGQAERRGGNARGRLVERLAVKAHPAGQNGGAEHQENVADDRAGDGGFDHTGQALGQSHQRDDQLGGIAEGGVEQPADAMAGAGTQMLGSPAHPAGQRNDRDARDDEKQGFVLPGRNITDGESRRHGQQQPVERLQHTRTEPTVCFFFGRHISGHASRRGSVHHGSMPGLAGASSDVVETQDVIPPTGARLVFRNFLHGGRIRLALASRREVRADPLQKCPYFLSKDMHFRFVDQLQHGLGIHEGNRYGSIGFFAHDHVAR